MCGNWLLGTVRGTRPVFAHGAKEMPTNDVLEHGLEQVLEVKLVGL